MKVKFKHMLNGYTGVADDSVIYYMQRLGRCVIRKRPRKHENAQQNNFRAMMRNMFFIHPSEDYKKDLKAYLTEYHKLKLNEPQTSVTWNNLYMKLMFEMQRRIPGVNLSTITKEQIYASNMPCINVKMAVEAGLLPAVSGYQRLDAQI